ncbi:VOC family protein [Streptomyces anulatus]
MLAEVDEHHVVMADPEGNEFCVAADGAPAPAAA